LQYSTLDIRGNQIAGILSEQGVLHVEQTTITVTGDTWAIGVQAHSTEATLQGASIVVSSTISANGVEVHGGALISNNNTLSVSARDGTLFQLRDVRAVHIVRNTCSLKSQFVAIGIVSQGSPPRIEGSVFRYTGNARQSAVFSFNSDSAPGMISGNYFLGYSHLLLNGLQRKQIFEFNKQYGLPAVPNYVDKD
ncbi:MAG: hypothetical protein SNJ56_00255, partial [Termitinemataceae bacterium]